MIDETSRFSPEDVAANKGISIVSYIGILFFIPLLVNSNSPYIKFHVNQGLINFILAVVLGVCSGILNAIFGGIPLIGWVVRLATGLFYVPTLILAIMGIVNAVQGQAKRLPVIGNIELIK